MNLTQFYKIIIKICPVCEKPFLQKKGRGRPRKFCSKNCKIKYTTLKQYEKAKSKSLKNGELAKQKTKDKETINKKIFRQLLKEEQWESTPNEISLIKQFHQNDNKYGLGSAGNKLSEHPHPNFKKEYELILESELALGLISENEYYKKLKTFKIF